MSEPQARTELKSADHLLWEHYMRTGQRLTGEAAQRFIERKFNPNHDPSNGQFTFGYGGLNSGGQSTVRSTQSRPGTISYPVRNKMPPPSYPVRIELPPSKPAQISRPKPAVSANHPNAPHKHFSHSPGLDLPDEVVHKANALSDAVQKVTGHRIHVTSGRRGPT